MKKRGKILRDPGPGPGLLMAEGRQYWFSREQVWMSAIPPKPGLDVVVTFDRGGEILEITAVCDSQVAGGPTPSSTSRVRLAGMQILRTIAAKCGMGNYLPR